MKNFKLLRKCEMEDAEFGFRRATWNPPLPTPKRGVITIIWLGRIGLSWFDEFDTSGLGRIA